MRIIKSIYNYNDLTKTEFIGRLSNELKKEKIYSENESELINFSNRKYSINYQNKSFYNAIKPPLIGTVKTEESGRYFKTIWNIKNEGIIVRLIIFLLMYSFVNYLLGYDLWSNIFKCVLLTSIIFGTYVFGMKSKIKKILRKLEV